MKKIKFVKVNKASPFKPGQIVSMADSRADEFVRLGFAVQVGEKVSPIPPKNTRPTSIKPRETSVKRKIDKTEMLPPRFICRCGFVAETSEKLKSHIKGCI